LHPIRWVLRTFGEDNHYAIKAVRMLTLHIPDANPEDRSLTAELRREVALVMYQRQTWSLGQAARYAGIPYVFFQQLMSDRGIPMNYDEADFLADVETIRKRRV
jgi:predicted HTH domain antitoxin